MKIGIIDIETTGFLQKGGKIVEIGIVSLDLTSGKRQLLFDSVTHEKPITKEEVQDSWIVKNSSLTVEDIQHSRQLGFLKSEIQSIINSFDHGVTAYNNKFDFEFMESRGFQFPKKLGCPMKLLTDKMKLPSKYGNNYKWPNVEEAYRFLIGDIDYTELHRSGPDAMDESEIVYEMYKRGWFPV